MSKLTELQADLVERERWWAEKHRAEQQEAMRIVDVLRAERNALTAYLHDQGLQAEPWFREGPAVFRAALPDAKHKPAPGKICHRCYEGDHENCQDHWFVFRCECVCPRALAVPSEDANAAEPDNTERPIPEIVQRYRGIAWF